MEMKDVLWSDWGNQARIVSGLEKIGETAGDCGRTTPLPTCRVKNRVVYFSHEGAMTRWLHA
jgi:hypothetical protein